LKVFSVSQSPHGAIVGAALPRVGVAVGLRTLTQLKFPALHSPLHVSGQAFFATDCSLQTFSLLSKLSSHLQSNCLPSHIVNGASVAQSPQEEGVGDNVGLIIVGVLTHSKEPPAQFPLHVSGQASLTFWCSSQTFFRFAKLVSHLQFSLLLFQSLNSSSGQSKQEVRVGAEGIVGLGVGIVRTVGAGVALGSMHTNLVHFPPHVSGHLSCTIASFAQTSALLSALESHLQFSFLSTNIVKSDNAQSLHSLTIAIVGVLVMGGLSQLKFFLLHLP